MPQIECNYNTMLNTASEMYRKSDQITEIADRMMNLCLTMPISTSFFRRLRLIFQGVLAIGGVYRTSATYVRMADALNDITEVYKAADSETTVEAAKNPKIFLTPPKSISEIVAGIINYIKNVAKNWNIYSSEEGQYGGDQGSPSQASQAEKLKYYELYMRNNPDSTMTWEQFNTYLERLNSEGCGYVSLVNVIMHRYQANPEEFERIFGFPLKDSEGHFNYNLMLVDIYSRMDNRDTRGNIDPYMDYDSDDDGPKSSYDIYNDDSGWGTTAQQREYYFEQYLKEHGLSGDFNPNAKVSPSDYNRLRSEGTEITISYRYGIMHGMYGAGDSYIPGGHAITVTGVTDDGKWIVSSWGEKYYIDPNETFTYRDGKIYSSTGEVYTGKFDIENGTTSEIEYQTARIND